MNRDEPDLDELLAPLRDGPIALSSASDAAALRARLLPRVRRAVRDVPLRLADADARRRAMKWVGGCAIAAAALLAFGLVRGRAAHEQLASDGLRLEPLGAGSAEWIGADGGRRSIEAADALHGSGELVAAESSWSRLSTPQGVRVDLAPRTRLRVREAAARDKVSAQLNLVAGEVHCQVPKLGKRAQFSIATPDAHVIVHGTRFSVQVGGDGRPGTCVRVSEGLVEVRHAGQRTMLPRGAQWGCDQPEVVARAPEPAHATAQPVVALPAIAVPAVPAAERAAERATAGRASPSRRAAARRAARAAKLAAASAANARATEAEREAARAGTLGDENRLLTAALAAERNRNEELARSLFQQLLARNPSSPLAPEAREGLARLR